MKFVKVFALAAVATMLFSGSAADAGLFAKMCCKPACCEPEPCCPEPEPCCAAPEPACCEPAPAPCCEPEPVCCEPEPVCCEPEPVCCEPAPVCCEPEPCCRPTLLQRLKCKIQQCRARRCGC